MLAVVGLIWMALLSTELRSNGQAPVDRYEY